MASLVLEDVVPPPAHVVLPRLELSLCGGDLAEFDEHAVEPALFAADPEGITSHPKLAVRPWRPPGMETAPALPWAAAMPHLLGHVAFGTPLRDELPPSLPPGAGGAWPATPADISRGRGGEEGGANAEGEREQGQRVPGPEATQAQVPQERDAGP